MKMKYIIPAISFALIQPVMAQSSSNVVLYGTLDIGVARLFNDATTGVRGSKSPANWGVRGREDLGNGSYAMFHLESSQIAVDTGSYADAGGFTRQSWVGIGGGFGEVMLGRTTTPQARFMGRYDLNGLSEVNPWKTLDVGSNSSLGGARHSNQVQYASPQLGSVQFRASYSFDETQKGQSGSRDANFQLGINYKKGNWNAGAVLMPKSLAGKIDTVDEKAYQHGFSVGMLYDNKAFKTSLLVQRDEQRSLGDSVGFGISVPLGALEIGAQYAQVIKSSNANRENASALELFSNYKLSKRTTLYLIAATVNNKTQDVRNLQHKNSLSAGLLHRF